jgi:serine/threonine protein kinase
VDDPRWWLGKRIDNYKIEEYLGQGGTCLTFKAWDVNGKRVVVLKLVPSDWKLKKPRTYRLFQRELEIFRTLKPHSNIVPYIYQGEHDGTHYLVTEFMSGGSLRELLIKNRYAVGEERGLSIILVLHLFASIALWINQLELA